MKIFWSVVITIFVIFVIGLIVIYSGVVNIGANEPVGGFTKWVLVTTKNNSIEARIDEIKIPDLNNENMIREGAEHYNEMCVGCHGAPGMEETEISKGLEPPAPHIYKMKGEVNPAEIFWVTKNGIQMSGMPAWGKTHSDDKIWAIVSFVKKLPELSADEYKEYTGGHHLTEEEMESENEHDEHSR